MVSLPRIKLPSPGRVYIPRPHMPHIAAKVRFRFVNKGHRIANYMLRWQKMFLYRSGAAIRAYAINSFKRRKNKNIHSPPGSPPYAHLAKSEFLRKAIQFAVYMTTATAGGLGRVVVGAHKPSAGFWGAKHEHGGYFGRERGTVNVSRNMAFFPPRPFMRPAFRRWLRYGLPKIMKDTGRKAWRL